MKHRALISLFVLTAVLLIVTPVFAYIYRAPYTVTSENTTDFEMLGVYTDNAVANQWMADNGFFNSTANDTRIETLGGLDKPHMVTDDKTFTAIPVPANSQTNLYFSTGNSEQDFYIIPGYGGYVTVVDEDTIELGDNFTIEQSGWVDTSYSANKNLVYKEDAFRTYISGTGNITALIRSYIGLFADTFDTDIWTDVGTKIAVDTGDSRLEYEAERSADDTRCYYDLTTPVSDTEWVLDCTWHPVSRNANGFFTFGLWETPANFEGYSDDGIVVLINNSEEFFLVRWDEGVFATAGGIGFTFGSTYYLTLERTAANNATLSVYSDPERTTHIAGSPDSLAIPVTVVGLQYLQGSNTDDNVGAAEETIGWIDDVSLNDRFVVATGVESKEQRVTVSANTTHMWISIDSVTKDTVALGGVSVPNNSSNWTFMQNNVIPYSDNTSIEVDGVLELWFRPNDIISGTTLPDRATSVANDGTFTFGSNPTGVSVTMGGLVSSSQPSPGVTVEDPTPDIMPGVEVTDWYIEPDVGGALLTNPMRPFVTMMSDTTTLTELQAWRILGTALLLLVTVATAKAVRGHHAITGIAAGACILALVVWTIYPMWALVFMAVAVIAGLISERTPSV